MQKVHKLLTVKIKNLFGSQTCTQSDCDLTTPSQVHRLYSAELQMYGCERMWNEEIMTYFHVL
jgi:hypothetical protein